MTNTPTTDRKALARNGQDPGPARSSSRIAEPSDAAKGRRRAPSPSVAALLSTLVLCSSAIFGSLNAEATNTVSAANEDNVRIVSDKTTLDMSDDEEDTFRVKLGERPSGNMRVRVSVSPSDSGLTIDVDTSTAGNQDTLQFDRFGQANPWNQYKHVKVTFDPDNAANRKTFTITLTGLTSPIGDNNNYVGKTTSLSVVANVSLLLDKTTLTLNEGDQGSIGVRLETRPSGNMRVRFGVTPSNLGLSIDTDSSTPGLQNTLQFDRYGQPNAWNRYKYVTVFTSQDIDARDETFTVSLTGLTGPGGGNNNYVNKTASVAVSVSDEEEEEIDVGEFSINIDEGQEGTFKVKLTAAPVSSAPVATATVTISTSGPITASPSSLSFRSTNYLTERTVTVTTTHDNDGTDSTGIVAFSSSGGYSATAGKRIIVLDDDGSIEVSSDAVELIEGSRNGSFTVALGAPPASSATISVTSKDTGAVKVSPATLTFSSSNYSTAQTVNLFSVSDADTDDESVMIELDATAGYRASKTTKTISVVDARQSSIIVSRPQEVLVIPEGGSKTFTVGLNANPNENVSISLTKTNSDITLSPTSLTFTASNWSTPQIVTVTAAEDDDTTVETDTITLSASGGITSANVVKNIRMTDNDTLGVIEVFDAAGASLSTGSATISVEEGADRTIAVRLDTLPNDDVHISLTKTNDDITLTPSSLTFTVSNWDVLQNIVVAAAVDTDSDDDSDTLTLSASGGIIASDWSATINVEEPPSGAIRVPSSLSVGERGFGRLRVSLDSAPSSVPVVVSLAHTNDDFHLFPLSLTFTASNWNDAQTVIVEHRPAASGSGNAADTDTITLSASGGIVASNRTVSVAIEGSIRGAINTDPPRFIDVDEGGAATFSVTLDSTWDDSNLNAQVAVSLESINRKVAISPSVLTFSASDWNVPQTVTLTSEQDAGTANESDIILLNASGGIDARRGTLLVTVKDDDIPSGALVMSDAELVIDEGGLKVFGVRLSEEPNANEDVIVALSKHSFGITLSSPSLIFDASNWNEVQLVAVGAMQDDDIEDETHTISLDVYGGMISSPRTKRIRVIDDDESGPDPVRSQALAFPSIAAQDDATLRVRCNQDIPCIVHLDCSAQNDGSIFQGRLPAAIPAWGTHTLDAAEIERSIGGSWSGKGRLGCALRSRARISSQVWTRSGNGVLVNNSASIRSAPRTAGRHRADIESISAPGEADQSNLRIRCLAPISEHCTNTVFSCFDDQGRRHEGGVGAIVRLTTRHLQSEELAAIIGHRWSGMGLSCELHSDHPFTVQMLTRTGGGGALVNNSATGSASP